MKAIIHDLKDAKNDGIIIDNSKELIIISDNETIKPCICCFCCWIKTPGVCVINDGYDNLGKLLSECKELIVISQCFYGGYSPFIKNVIDRFACPSLLPYFETRNGETHHPRRYKNTIKLSVMFYGDISEAEKETALKLVKANEINLFDESSVSFHDSYEEIKGVFDNGN